MEPSTSKIIPIPPPVPFSHRLKPLRVDKEFEKFINIFKQLHIHILFVDAICRFSHTESFSRR